MDGGFVSFALRYLFGPGGFRLLAATGPGAPSTLLSVFFSGMRLPPNVFLAPSARS